MEIRKLKREEIPEVVELWYQTSVVAHDFIDPTYWAQHKEVMGHVYLPKTNTIVAVEANRILGFVSMIDDFLAAIFVLPESQGKGVGSSLLKMIKENHSTITLCVFKKNVHSLAFYQHQGFRILSEDIDKPTGESEYTMKWKK